MNEIHAEVLLEALLRRFSSYDLESYGSYRHAKDILDKTPEPGNLEAIGAVSPLEDVTLIGFGKFPPDSVLMTRVVRNDLAYHHREWAKQHAMTDALLFLLGRYSDVWIRKLLSDQKMLHLMRTTAPYNPYSLFAAHTSYDETTQTIVQRPLIIIPGVIDKDNYVQEWENRNTFHRRRGGNLGIMTSYYRQMQAQNPNTPSGTSPAQSLPQNP